MSLPRKTLALIAQYKPSMIACEQAYLCRDIWLSVSAQQQKAWRKKTGYHSIPKIHQLTPSKAAVFSALIAAETDKLDVFQGWGALDAGSSPASVKRALAAARKLSLSQPEIAFPRHFRGCLTALRCNVPPPPPVDLPLDGVGANDNDNKHINAKPESPPVVRTLDHVARAHLAVEDDHSPKRPSLPSNKRPRKPVPRAEPLAVAEFDLPLIHKLALMRRIPLQMALHQLIRAGVTPLSDVALKENREHRLHIDDFISMKEEAPKKPKAKSSTPRQPKPLENNRLAPLHERLKIVMGQDAVGIDEAIARLAAHNKLWLPKSKDLKAYISLILSTHIGDGDLFDRVSRGIYQVKKSSQKKASKKKKKVSKKATPPQVKKTNGAHESNGMAGLEEFFGPHILDSPFSGAVS